MKILALIILFSAFATPGYAREWESSQGIRIQADFFSRLGEDVQLKKKDGKIIRLKLSQLSKHDQEIILLLEKHRKEILESTKKIGRLEKEIDRLQDRTDASERFGQKKRGAKAKAKPKVIATFVGTGSKNTRPFSVPAGWEIQWDAKGDIFQMCLHLADGSIAGFPASQQGSGTGSTYQAKAGKYYLDVSAIGKWSINIVDVDE